MSTIPIVDVFAGPGGLNEGFSSILDADGKRVFRSVASFEMGKVECETLRLRAALRSAQDADGRFPDTYYEFLAGQVDFDEMVAHSSMKDHWLAAGDEVHEIELGLKTREVTDEIIRKALGANATKPWVLVGGPPCQAYSLAGRSRRKHDITFVDDVKHFLYREYLRIIREFRPPVFVMENVKGLLSHNHEGRGMFARIIADLSLPEGDRSPEGDWLDANLRDLGYNIRSFVSDKQPDALEPKDFLIQSERYGIPQKRHRVILLGIRKDQVTETFAEVLTQQATVTVHEAIGQLPAIRSRISPRREDDQRTWRTLRDDALRLAGEKGGSVPSDLGWSRGGPLVACVESNFGEWLQDRRLQGVTQHEARGHMAGDLQRYAYLSAMSAGRELGHAAIKVNDLPARLMPNHKNVGRVDTPFADRFRVQGAKSPSTTIVSHISKDGHYYIHPDPNQMRSLTVREAARLQTFPDNYFFCGNRTQQYHQVGNAVPPLLARQLALVVKTLLS